MSSFYQLGRVIGRLLTFRKTSVPAPMRQNLRLPPSNPESRRAEFRPPPVARLPLPNKKSDTVALRPNVGLARPQAKAKQTDFDRLVDALKSGSPVVLLHGRAGTGKTTLIRGLKQAGIRHVVVAPTGIAALNAGGQTIHSFFGLPPRIIDLEDITPRHRLGSILRRIDVIVIDEVSMVRADLLDAIDKTLRVNLDSQRPFGGKTLLLVGDFLQLPPIVNEDDAPILQHRGYDVFHAFGAKCIHTAVRPRLIELTNVYRQNDPEFLDLLHGVRIGEKLDDTISRLNDRCHGEHRSTSKPVILTCRTEAASEYNRQGLAALPGAQIRFLGIVEGNFRITKDKLPAPEYLELKVGARIMMVKNDREKRWVNGSLGTVSKLKNDSIWVRLDGSEVEHEVHTDTWESVEYRYDQTTQRVEPVVVGSYTQFPLVAAWAMTIHKAQGLTLSDVRIDLGHGAFSPGQTYVALSRARSLEGLSFSQPLRASDVMADTHLVEGVRKMTAAAQS